MALLNNTDVAKSPTGSGSTIIDDLIAGGVVFLVALPLCLGIALASGGKEHLFSGLVAGIIGGIIVGAISKSHTSVSGPAAGLTAIVASQIDTLGFEGFLLAVAIGGLLQIVLGLLKAGVLSAWFPSSVIKGLLAAIGVILILKQIPHLVGHDTDYEGSTTFWQPDKENTFSELLTLIAGEIHIGSVVIGLTSIALLVIWNKSRLLKNLGIPAPLVVVVAGVVLNLALRQFGGHWAIGKSHLVDVPIANSASEFMAFLKFPDFSQLSNPAIYIGAVTIAIVASLETLLSLEAVDKLDPQRRDSQPSRELIAQGCGNVVAGLIGGLPVTSVIVRSSVNVSSGAKTKLSAVFHGLLLLISVAFLPAYLNLIPLSALAAILIMTGLKLASPKLFKQMWRDGRNQFIPFAATVVSIVFTDLLSGILIGLAVSILFILHSNLRRPMRRVVKTHLNQQVTHVELANQVSFMNRAAFDKLLTEAASGSHLTIDARDTDYIDPDVLGMIREFRTETAPVRGVTVSLRGFTERFGMEDDAVFANHATRELQDQVTPDQVLEILKEGNRRFRTGDRLTRDFGHQVHSTAEGQTPLAVVLSCIDSRVPAELVLDMGLGDIFSVRVAGSVIGRKSLGSIEYGVGVAGVKLVLVMGHTRCGAVTSSVELVHGGKNAVDATGCENLQSIVDEISPCIANHHLSSAKHLDDEQMEQLIDEVARDSVRRTVHAITDRSSVIRAAIAAGKIRLVGAMYDVKTGEIVFLED